MRLSRSPRCRSLRFSLSPRRPQRPSVTPCATRDGEGARSCSQNDGESDPNSSSSSLWPEQLLATSLSGAALGPLCDSLHSRFGVLRYERPFHVGFGDGLETTWWTPVRARGGDHRRRAPLPRRESLEDFDLGLGLVFFSFCFVPRPRLAPHARLRLLLRPHLLPLRRRRGAGPESRLARPFALALLALAVRARRRDAAGPRRRRCCSARGPRHRAVPDQRDAPVPLRGRELHGGLSRVDRGGLFRWRASSGRAREEGAGRAGDEKKVLNFFNFFSFLICNSRIRVCSPFLFLCNLVYARVRVLLSVLQSKIVI